MTRRLHLAECMLCVAFLCSASYGAGAEAGVAARYSESVFSKARTFEREGKYREAAAEYDAIAAKYSGDDEPARSYRLDALYYAGMSLVRARDWPAAKQRFEKVLAAADDAAERKKR